MAKSLSDILKGVNSSTEEPLSLPDDIQPAKGGKEFVGKHKVKKYADRVGNSDDVYKGTIKQTKNSRHGYSGDEDEKVYK